MEDNLPKVLIMENVTALYEQKFIKQWNEIQLEIEQLGYTNYSFTLNSKNFGIAQNRDRAFMVSILGEWNYVKPEEFTLTTRLKDYLELSVDESYYLSEKMLKFFEENTRKNKEKGNGFKFSPTDGSDVAKTITTRSGSRMDDNFLVSRLGGIFDKDGKRHQAGSIYNKEGLAPTIDTMQGGYREPLVFTMPEATKQGYVEAHDGDGVYIDRPHQKRGVVQDGMIPTLKTSGNDIGVVVAVAQRGRGKDNIQNIEVSDREIANSLTTVQKDSMVGMVIESTQKNAYRGTTNDPSPALTSAMGEGGGHVPMIGYADGVYLQASKEFQSGPLEGLARTLKAGTHDSGVVINKLTIRKLTPTETGRLMGMPEHLIEKQLKTVSKSQAYKQHGNGIVADVMAYIVGMMYYETQDELKSVIDEYNARNCYAFKKGN